MASVDPRRESLAVKVYCFDMLGRIANLLEKQGDELEIAELVRRAARAARHRERSIAAPGVDAHA